MTGLLVLAVAVGLGYFGMGALKDKPARPRMRFAQLALVAALLPFVITSLCLLPFIGKSADAYTLVVVVVGVNIVVLLAMYAVLQAASGKLFLLADAARLGLAFLTLHVFFVLRPWAELLGVRVHS